MLKSLTVKNFTIIEETNLEFNAGMSVITGETGTGKSILFGALGLALGQRAQAHHLNQHGSLSVTLDIDLGNSPATQAWLEEADLASGGECILRRTITHTGRSRAFINGVQVPLLQLQTLGRQLVEIVGQNTQQSLTQPERQLAIVDAQCGHDEALQNLRDTQEQWAALTRKLKQRLEQNEDIKARISLLEYQITELREFSPEDEEFLEMERSYKRLSKKDFLQQEIHKALALLEETEAHDAASRIFEAAQIIKPLTSFDAGVVTAVEQLNVALEHMQIASQELRSCLEEINVDEERYHELEKRLQGYFDLSRKYGVVPEKLGALYQKLQADLDEIKAPGASVEELQRQQADLKASYSTFAEEIGKRREAAATVLSKRVTQTLHKLNMQSADFSVLLKPYEDDTPKRHGNERAEFFIRTNPGHPPALLEKIASGGELSRIGLALQAASATKSQKPILIFDEIDTGVGGKTAEMIGKLLKAISQGAQVFCITHLPQIAAQADHHFAIDKQQQGQRVRATAKKLSMAERHQEIARMTAGAKITEKSLAHAGEMLGRGRNAAANQIQ